MTQKTDGMITGHTYAGLFMVTLVTLMYEILLTRIFSVAMWYHYAFLAVSIALFGMTVGAVLVYLLPAYFTQDKIHYHLALSAWLFSLSLVFSFLTYASIPFVTSRSLVIVYSIALMYAVISVPFVFSGICVSLALTRFSRRVGGLYATDLAGAACGCLMVMFALRFTDGPGAVLVAAFLAAAGAVLFALAGSSGVLTRTALVSALVFALLAGGQAFSVAKQFPLLRLVWVKGQIEGRPLYEKWNSFSRIRVLGDPETRATPFGWGFSASVPRTTVRELALTIDASATTMLTSLDGGLGNLQFLRYDVTNLANYLRRDANVLVIGSGGGRDVLSALLFGQKSVVAVELNQDITYALNRRFGDFTGHLDKDSRVTFINDEARSYIARQRARFDIIQGSFTTTWAATAAGAFVLSENSVYTVEAWKLFLDRLTDNGLLSFSRWYVPGMPAEMYRLTAIASASLRLAGVQNPRSHIIIITNLERPGQRAVPAGVGTILVSKQPFSDDEINTIDRVARSMRFGMVLNPRHSIDSTFAALASAEGLRGAIVRFPLNIAPSSDDNPFFFYTLRLHDIGKRALWTSQIGMTTFITNPVFVLFVLLLTVLALTLMCIIIPLSLTAEKAALRGAGSLFVFFASIGFGFMFIEISQMQRLTIFLGHPTYSLSVVLFVLLLSSSLGSYLIQRFSGLGVSAVAGVGLGFLLCSLALFGLTTSHFLSSFSAAATSVRLLVAGLILFPLGLFMGIGFPLGMSVASERYAALTPWFWGLNGATSVCGSVLAFMVALNTSISTSFWTGFVCYAVACGALVTAARKEKLPTALREIEWQGRYPIGADP